MDPITHVMSGTILAHVAAGLAPEPAASLTCIAASILPDLDYYSRKLPGAAFLKTHHGATHSLMGASLSALLCAGVAWLFFNLPFPGFSRVSFVSLAFLSIASALSHILLDLIMQNNGLPLLWPLSRIRFAVPLIIAVNPSTVSRQCHEKKFSTCIGCQSRAALRNPIAWLTVIFALAGYILLPHRRIVGIIGGVLITLYVIWVQVQKERARTVVGRFEPDASSFRAYPGRARPDRWLFVRDRSDGSAVAYLTESHSPALLRKWVFTAPLLSPFVAQSCQRIMNDLKESIFHVYPEVVYQDEMTSVTFRDLSFLYSEPLELGSVRVTINQEGRIVSEIFQEVW